MSRRVHVSFAVVLLALIGAGAGLWIAQPQARELLLARRPGAADSLATTLATAPCDAALQPDAEALLAALIQDEDDLGCAGEARFGRLIAEHPDPRWTGWLTRLLTQRQGPARLRLRACLALILREGALPEVVRRELRAGAFGPVQIGALVDALSEEVGPAIAEELLNEGGAPRFDAGDGAALRRFAGGDWSARYAVARALRRELAHPTLRPEPDLPGLSSRRATITAGVLEGLGVSHDRLQAALNRLDLGLNDSSIPDDLMRRVRRHRETCADPRSDGCAALLLSVLEAPPMRVDEREQLTPMPERSAPPLPSPWQSLVDSLSVDPALVAEAAEWLRAGESRPGRILGAVANPRHGYGHGPWAAGQRGDPAVALRYGGGTPGAVGVAAFALAAAADAPLTATRWRDVLVLRSGDQRALIGPCGPGDAPPAEELLPMEETPLSAADLVDLARMEQLGWAMERGAIDEALALDATLQAPERWPRYATLRASLLACQGVAVRGLPVEDLAFVTAWAVTCDERPTAEALAAHHSSPITVEALVALTAPRDTLRPRCADPWRVRPPG